MSDYESFNRKVLFATSWEGEEIFNGKASIDMKKEYFEVRRGVKFFSKLIYDEKELIRYDKFMLASLAFFFLFLACVTRLEKDNSLNLK